jgi:general stress protein YciG
MIIPKKLPKDPNQRAHAIARMLTEGPEPGEIVTEQSAHMAEIGRKGGKRGGQARSEKLSSERRKEIAKTAAKSRWSK